MVDALSAKIEMELGELDPDEAAVFMEELGLAESSLDRVIALSYRLVGLISFLTAGPDEVRAWPIPDGSNAVDAAGAIHTDLARGFIRAETIALRGPAGAGLDRRGEEARQGPLGGQDLPRPRRGRDRDPVQPVGLSPAEPARAVADRRARRRPARRRQLRRLSPPWRSARIDDVVGRSGSGASRSARKFSSSSFDTLTAAVSRSSVIAMKP